LSLLRGLYKNENCKSNEEPLNKFYKINKSHQAFVAFKNNVKILLINVIEINKCIKLSNIEPE